MKCQLLIKMGRNCEINHLVGTELGLWIDIYSLVRSVIEF